MASLRPLRGLLTAAFAIPHFWVGFSGDQGELDFFGGRFSGVELWDEVEPEEELLGIRAGGVELRLGR